MTSNRPNHIEAMHQPRQGSEATKAPCSLEPQLGQSVSAAMKKTTLDGSEHHLGIPNIQDRVIQQAILQVLTPIFDPGFSESSFGFRPKRSAHAAAKQVQAHICAGYRQCVDMDLSKFFDRVQHDVLLARVARKVHDKLGRLLRFSTDQELF